MSSMSQRIEIAMAAYERRFGRKPNRAMVNLRDFEQAGGIEVRASEALRVSAVIYVAPGTVLVGVEE